jgi:hypothetical protein
LSEAPSALLDISDSSAPVAALAQRHGRRQNMLAT